MSQQSIEEQIQALIVKEATKQDPTISGYRSLRRKSFIDGALFLLPLLKKAIEQRDASLEMLSPDYFHEGQIDKANSELIQLLEASQKGNEK